MRILLKTMMLLAAGACSVEHAADSPAFVYENFLGEGRPEYKTISPEIDLYRSPSNTSSLVSTESLPINQTLAFDEVVTKTIREGKIEISGEHSIRIRNFGEVENLTKALYYDESIAWVEKIIGPADEPTMLMWMSEGSCLLKIKKTVNESTDCPVESGNDWELLTQPETESWIKVGINNSSGWVKTGSPHIEEFNRSF